MNPRKITANITENLTRQRWRSLLASLLLLLATVNVIGGANTANELSWRELLIPAAELPRVLQSWPGATMVSQEEFEQLLQKSQSSEQQKPPFPALLRHAQQVLTIFQDRAFWTCQATAETLADGDNLLAINTEGLLWNSVQVQEQPAMASLHDGKLNLLLQGKPGNFELLLKGEVTVSTEGAQKKLSCRLPNAVSGDLKIIVPGDVILQDGPPMLERDYDSASQLTTFIMIPPREKFSLTLSLNQRLQQNASLVQTVTRLDNHLSASGEELTARVELQIHRQPINSLRFAVPEGFEVISVKSDTAGGVASWEIDQDRVLTIKTRAPWSDTANLTCQLYSKRSPIRDNWHFPLFKTIDCASNSTNLWLWAEQSLDCRNLNDIGLIHQPPARQTNWLLPPKIIGGRDTSLLVIAYAPGAFQLQANIVEKPPQIESYTNTKLQISEDDLQAAIDVTIKSRQGKCFQAIMQLPTGWKYLAPEQQDHSAVLGAPDNSGLLTVQFPHGINQGQEQSFTVNLRQVPPGWEQTWQEARQITAPLLEVMSSTRQTGKATAQARSPLRLELQDAENCRPVEPDRNQPNAHIFSFSSLPARLAFAVSRPESRLTAEIYTLVKVNQDHLASVHEITYIAQQTPVREVTCRLPDFVPATLSVRGLANTLVKEHRSQVVDGSRLVTVMLAAESNQPRITMSYQTPIIANGQRTEVPLAEAASVEGQHGRLAIEGEADLDVSILTPPRPIDVGELHAAAHQPGRRLLGAFAYSGLPPSVGVAIIRQPAHALPPLLVRFCQGTTTVSSSGLAQHSARFFFRPNLPQLLISLPESAILWSAVLDGEPSVLQRGSITGADGAPRSILLLPLPPSETEERLLEITYETPLGRFQRLGNVHATLPNLGYVDTDGDWTTAPTANINWKMAAPENFHPIVCKGNLRSQTRTVAPISPWLPEPIAARAGKMLYTAAGKINLNNGLKGLLQAFVGNPREKAEQRYLGVLGDAPAEHREESRVSEFHSDSVSKSLESTKERKDKRIAVAKSGISIDKITAPTDWLSQDSNKSLQIDLLVQGDKHEFDSMSDAASIQLTILHCPTVQLLQAGIFLLLVSLSMLPSLWRRFSRRGLFAWLAVSALIPCLPGLAITALLGDVFFMAGLTVAALHALGFLLSKCLFKAGTAPTSSTTNNNATVLTIIIMLLLPVFFSGTWAQDAADGADNAAKVSTTAVEAPATLPPAPVSATATSTSPGASVRPDPTQVEVIKPSPLPLPSDAVIIPYGDSPAQLLPERLLPYEFYHRLRLGAQPPLPPPGASMFSTISYSATLADNDSLVFTARLQAVIPAATAVPLPSLSFQNAVPTKVNINGQPAAAWGTTQQPQQLTLAPMPPGKHDLEISWLATVTRQGGWRRVNLALPAPAPAELTLEIPEEGAEISLRSRRQNWHEQIKAGTKTINITLDDEVFSLQWRLPTSEISKDSTLSAESIVDYLIIDSGTEITWDAKMQFRGQARSLFELTVPSALPTYHILTVTGANVRGWQSQPKEGKTVLTVHLLRAVEASESFQVKLWQASRNNTDAHPSFAFPDLAVPEATRHQLTARLRRQGDFDLQIEAKSPTARRCEPGKFAAHFTADNEGAEFWETTFTPLAVDLSIKPLPDSLDAVIQTLHRLDAGGQSIDGKILLKTGRRHRPRLQVNFPAAFSLDSLTGNRLFRYEEHVTNSERQVVLHLVPGDGDATIYFTGKNSVSVAPGSVIPLPVIQVIGAERHEAQLAVLAPGTLKLQERNLTGMQTVLAEVVHPWLAPANRPYLRLALQAREFDYHGQLLVSAKPTTVTGSCTVSVRFTEALQQETCLFDLQIDGALETFSFLAPKYWRAANLEAPLLRNCRVEADNNNDDLVRYTLTFQNQLTGKAQILLELDRLPPTESQELQCMTADQPLTCYILVENSGRDEVETTAGTDAAIISPEETLPPTLQQLRKNKQTQIFAIKNAATGRVHCRSRIRELVATAQARIGLATTTLTMTPEGLCQGETTLQIDNRSEQFLQLRLPAKARLWSVKVAGELIKPVAPADIDDGVVLIPLLKTAEGDLDYPVTVKYSIQLPPPGRLRPTNFPLPATLNINIERTQVVLRLPIEYQWLNFTGELGQPVAPGTFHAETLTYQSSVIKRLSSALYSVQSSNYSRGRALLNAQVAMTQMQNTQMQVQNFQGAQKQLVQSQQIMQDFNTQQTLELTQRQQLEAAPARQQLKLQQTNAAAETRFAHVMPSLAGNWAQEILEQKRANELESVIQSQIAPAATSAPQTAAGFDRKQVTPTSAPQPADGFDHLKKAEVRDESRVAARGGARESRLAGAMTGRAEVAAAAPSAEIGNIQKAEAGAKFKLDQDVQASDDAPAVAEEALPPPPAVAAATNLASLDVPFCANDPNRWQIFLFSTARGGTSLQARSFARSTLASLSYLGQFLLTLLLIFVVLFLTLPATWRRLPPWLYSRRTLCQAGLISLIFGFLPILGILLLLSCLIPRQQKQA